MRVLDKKLKKVLELRTDTPAMLCALDALASFYGQPADVSSKAATAPVAVDRTLTENSKSGGNTLQARRTLRADLEKRGLELTSQFVKHFETVASQLELVQVSVHEFAETCNQVNDRLVDTDEATRNFLAESEGMEQRRSELLEKSASLSCFLDGFQLSEAQVHVRFFTLPFRS